MAGWIRAPAINVTVGITALRISLEGGRKMDRRGHGARRRIDGVPSMHREGLDP
jgi:hypothetical protein